MEVVASRVEELGKSKIVQLPQQPQPTNPTPATSSSKPRRKKKTDTAYADWDAKTYKGTEDSRRQDRDQRRLAREAKQKAAAEELDRKVKALQAFDDDDEDNEEAPEPDPPGPSIPVKPTKPQESVGVRNKRRELETRKQEKAKRDAEKAKAAENPPPDPPKDKNERKGKSLARANKDEEPKDKSPRKGKSPARSNKDEEPKAKSPWKGKSPARSNKETEQTKDSKKGKSPGRSMTPKEAPKTTQEKDGDDDDDATRRDVAGRTRGSKSKNTDTGDDSTNRAVGKKHTTKHIEDKDYDLDLDTGKFVKKKKPVMRDDEQDDDDDIDEIDDEDKDKDYDPDKEPDQGDDEDNEDGEDDEEEDDFPIPPLRTKKVAIKASDKSTSQKKKPKKGKTEAEEALEDLGDFVEGTFAKPAKQPRSKGSKETEHDACINPKEAARFRRAMRAETLELENAVKAGVDIEETYKTMIGHIVEACKDMRYDIPADIEAKDIIPAIDDLSCKAWQMKLQGIETAGEAELNVSKTDNAGICIAKNKYSIKDIMEYTEEVSRNWSELKRKNFNLAMKKIMGNMTIAHRMVADASQEMINLLDEIELPLWMKIADMTMRPLVLLEVPEVTVMCEEAKQLSRANEQVWDQTTKITTIMEAKSLPVLPASWGYDREGKAKKLIAGIVYKYVKDRMYWGQPETPATEVSKKFTINSTTMNRHILGKKYIGGKSSGGPRKPAAQKVEATNR